MRQRCMPQTLTAHFVHGARLVLRQAHAEGVFGGHALYGGPKVRTVKVEMLVSLCDSVTRGWVRPAKTVGNGD